MSEQEQKIYVPKCSAKQVTFRNGNSILKLGLHAETVAEWLREHANEKGWVNIGISSRKQPSQYGETHTVWLDTWKPQPQEQPAQPAPQPQRDSRDLLPNENDSIPF